MLTCLAAFFLLLPVALHGAPLSAAISAEENAGACRGASALSSNILSDAYVSERIYGLKGLSNVGRLIPNIYRGAQPEPEGYATLRAMGIKSVINLRAAHRETEAVEAAGMRSIEIPISMLETPDMPTIDKIIKAIDDPKNQPVYFHCALGEDRTGTVAAIYRMKVQGWPYESAISEMQAFGFNDIWINLKHFLKKFKD